MSKRVFGLIIFLSVFVSATSYPFPSFTSSTRYFAETSQKDSLDETLFFHFRPFTDLNLTPILSLSLSAKDVENTLLGMNATYALLSWVELETTLSQLYLFRTTASIANYFLVARAYTPTLLSTRFFIGGGWYKRFVSLGSVTLPALAFRSSFSEHDFVAEMGLCWGEKENLFGILKAATFDKTQSYNFNNPFGEVEIGTRFSKSLTLSAFVRYQILLGFGRLDRMLMGVNALFHAL